MNSKIEKETNDIVDELMESIIKSMPEELYVIKEVTFNSDVLNCEHCIFFENHNNPFSLWRYPAPDDDLPNYISKAMKFFMGEYGLIPKFVLIPFNVMSLYQVRPPLFPGETPRTMLNEVCREYGLAYTVMVPERLKNKVVGV